MMKRPLNAKVLSLVAFAGLSLGASAQITNPGFESSWTGWTELDSNFSSLSGVANTGSSSAKIEGASGEIRQTVSLSANTTYELSAYVNGNGTIGVVGGASATVNTSSFTEATVSFSTGSSGTATIFADYGGSGDVRFDDFSLTVLSSQTPFGGSARAIPGVIQAEDYDDGGQGIAYNDADSNNKGTTYRLSEGVDVQATTDTGGGYNVGWTATGEWLEYTVDVTAGSYDIELRVASSNSNPGDVEVELDGTSLGTFSVVSTGGWQSWQTLTISGVSLSGGSNQILRLNIINGGNLNVNYIEFISDGQSPFGGSAVSIPGTIQAEDFDDGGQGVAYNDADSSNNGTTYRLSEGVDIQATTDTGGGYNVGWTANGEWLEYTVNATAGTYDIDLRVASKNGNPGDVEVELGGTSLGTFSVVGTGGWQNWQTLTISNVAVSAGTQILRLNVINGGNLNINWIDFSFTPGSIDYASDLINLVPWKINIPFDSSDNDSSGITDWDNRNTNSAEIFNLVDYEYENGGTTYFGLNSAGDAAVFRAHCLGATTGGSQYPRSELRQLVEITPGNYDDDYWPGTKYQKMRLVGKFIHTPVVKPEVIIAQIHARNSQADDTLKVGFDNDEDVIYLTYVDTTYTEYTTHPYLSSGATNPNANPLDYTIGDEIEVIVENKRSGSPDYEVYVQVNNLTTGLGITHTYIQGEDTDGYYFKAGCYTQSRLDKDDVFLYPFNSGLESGSEYGETEISVLELVENL